MMSQRQRVFFGKNNPLGEFCPTHSERKWKVSRENPNCAFSRFIGNDKAFKKLQTAAFSALGNKNHLMNELSFALFGPSSTGKTTLARLYAEVVQLPFVEINPKQIKSLEDFFNEVSRVMSDSGVPLYEYKSRNYSVPPCVIFIDEVHALSDYMIQGLLKATEYSDGVLATEKGRLLNMDAATWFIATTDEGKLFDAFRTRFSPIVLRMLSKKEIARVVKNANLDFSDKICDIVAHYNSRIPRKALEFARYMKMSKEMYPDYSWEDIAAMIAEDEGIDKYGMSEVHIKILNALGNGPIAKKRISLIVNCKDEEMDRFIMPWLLTETEDQPAFVTVTKKGYTITNAGLEELKKRGFFANKKNSIESLNQ
jgi:Holliday junction resolvasome RuvABC ATP-dependent DNA helicase subunit